MSNKKITLFLIGFVGTISINGANAAAFDSITETSITDISATPAPDLSIATIPDKPEATITDISTHLGSYLSATPSSNLSIAGTITNFPTTSITNIHPSNSLPSGTLSINLQGTVRNGLIESASCTGPILVAHVLSASISSGTAGYTSCTSSNAAALLDQQSRQIVRQISSYITNRIARDINPAFFGPKTENARVSSANSRSMMPSSLWSAFSWSRINSDSKANGVFDSNLYQTTTGVDKKIGNFYFGTTVTYAGSTADTNPNLPSSNHNVGLTPYAAYVFNKNFFISAMSGYNYTTNNFKGAQPESEADAYQTELDLNTLHVINQWFMKGRVGARYLHTHSKYAPILENNAVVRLNQDSWTYLVDAQAGYGFSNGLRTFTGILYEYNNSKLLIRQTDGIFYYSAGADYWVNKTLSLGATVQTDLNNPQIDLTTVALSVHLYFD